MAINKVRMGRIALEEFAADHVAFPTKEQGLQILCEMRRDGGPTYLGAKDLIDPWGNQLPCGPDGQS